MVHLNSGFRKTLGLIFNLFPTLSTEEQLEVREDLTNDAQPGRDYFILIVLSSIIATLGLIIEQPRSRNRGDVGCPLDVSHPGVLARHRTGRGEVGPHIPGIHVQGSHGNGHCIHSGGFALPTQRK